MKSILQEGSTVFDAIEKAWNLSGRPSIFSVKIISKEVRNFIGFVKKSAIISFSFDDSSIPNKKKYNKSSKNNTNSNSSVKSKETIKNEKIKNEKKQINFEVSEDKKKLVVKNSADINFDDDKNIITRDNELWRREYLEDVTIWLQEILELLGINIGFDIDVDGKMLNIYLNEHFTDDPENEKLFFIGISSLLVQFLRHKYKKRFGNYYIIINYKK